MKSFRLIRHLPFILTGAALAVLLPACGKSDKDKPADGKVALDSVEQRVSYGLGYNMGAGIAQQHGFSADVNAIRAGLEDGMNGSKTRIAETDIQAAFTTLQQRLAAVSAEQAGKQLAACNAFLDANKARKGVTTTASGLQYEVLKHGFGPKAKSTDQVTVHYHGTLIDGTVFDSSVERGTPAEFAVTGVIPGWVEALQLMSVGDKFKLYVPPALAYGPRANGKIPANSALIFEVELLKIK